MPKLRILTTGLEQKVQAAVARKMKRVFRKSAFLLDEQAEILQSVFANSQEFQSLGGRLKGQFGFTDAEVTNLSRILELLVPKSGNQISVKTVKTSGNKFALILDWVDFEKLKDHEFAQHALTKLDETGRVIDVTDIISWVEWLEEGVTIRGYQFFRPNEVNEAFSRSGEGLMRRSSSNFFQFEPTRIFEKIAKLETGKFLEKGFGAVLRREAGR